jgi:hypothetical protein
MENIMSGKISSTSAEKPETEKDIAAIALISGGVIGVGTASAKPKVKVKKEETKLTTVAIFSSRNINWQGVGSIVKGYNFVSEEASNTWLTRSAVRIASPDEIKANLG